MGRTDLEQLLYADAEHRILNPAHRELASRPGDRAFAPMRVRSIDRERRTVRATFSAKTIDRYEEIVDPEAFRERLDQFMTNPVLVANHQYSGPGGEPGVIGTIDDLRITSNELTGIARFMHDDPLADAWWKRFEQGVVRAFSVGFISLAMELRSVKMPGGQTQKLRVHTEAELIEISAVSIPANRESLVQNAIRAAGLMPGDGGSRAGAGDDGLSNRRLNKVLSRSLPSALKREVRSLLDSDSPELRSFIRSVVRETLEEASESRHSRVAGISDPPGGDEDWYAAIHGDDFAQPGELSDSDDLSRLFVG